VANFAHDPWNRRKHIVDNFLTGASEEVDAVSFTDNIDITVHPKLGKLRNDFVSLGTVNSLFKKQFFMFMLAL
jgi:hypothetical protein